MTIYKRLVLDIKTGTIIEADSYEYHGPIALCCGASSQQNDTYNQQAQLSNQIMQQGQTVFGGASSVFNDLVASLAPTIAAGPNQEGFSAAEKAALQSQAITNAGNAYKNARAATGDAIAAQGGGNTGLVSGANEGIEANLAESGAENTANQLNTINLQDYATGRQKYDTAVGDLEGATGVFNPATGLDNSATGALDGQANTANQIASQNNSWIQGVTGALGGIAGGAAGGYFSGLAKRTSQQAANS